MYYLIIKKNNVNVLSFFLIGNQYISIIYLRHLNYIKHIFNIFKIKFNCIFNI
jgi:hypothetical protein